MATFTVHMVSTISTAVEVEAEDWEEALELGEVQTPGPLCYSCSSDKDDPGEWAPVEVTNDEGLVLWREEL